MFQLAPVTISMH